MTLPDARQPLSADAAEDAFGAILDARVDEAAIEAFLIALADRGETPLEIAIAARAMRARMIRVRAPEGAIDVCGTGGDGHHSLNVSTAVSIVVAAAGVPVAKHGNRAASSRSGAADTLEALGLDLTRAAARAEESLAELGIAFLFAADHHPALRALAPLRRRMARRTIFNLLGPLANPAGVRVQMIGIARPELVPVYAEAMAMLDYDEAAVICGLEGLDELSPAGPSAVASIGDTGLPPVITPDLAGLAPRPLDDLRGGDAAHNADALRRLLLGEPGGYRDAVILNSAAALVLAGHSDTLLAGAEEAAETIDNGLANALLDCWIAWP
ncbi:anthranilate phosphoribosyltransferase [Sphingomonas sp. FW199]|uniref:anthranilate phosphoribosyltransferase n=1 Tax=Sphingomonas sp. FW199 TaxID=3400217 RepID=UPI003CECCC22